MRALERFDLSTSDLEETSIPTGIGKLIDFDGNHDASRMFLTDDYSSRMAAQLLLTTYALSGRSLDCARARKSCDFLSIDSPRQEMLELLDTGEQT